MNLIITNEYYRILNEVCELIPSMPWVVIEELQGQYSVGEVMNDVTAMTNEYNRQQQIKKNNLANFLKP